MFVHPTPRICNSCTLDAAWHKKSRFLLLMQCDQIFRSEVVEDFFNGFKYLAYLATCCMGHWPKAGSQKLKSPRWIPWLLLLICLAKEIFSFQLCLFLLVRNSPNLPHCCYSKQTQTHFSHQVCKQIICYNILLPLVLLYDKHNWWSFIVLKRTPDYDF